MEREDAILGLQRAAIRFKRPELQRQAERMLRRVAWRHQTRRHTRGTRRLLNMALTGLAMGVFSELGRNLIKKPTDAEATSTPSPTSSLFGFIK